MDARRALVAHMRLLPARPSVSSALQDPSHLRVRLRVLHVLREHIATPTLPHAPNALLGIFLRHLALQLACHALPDRMRPQGPQVRHLFSSFT